MINLFRLPLCRGSGALNQLVGDGPQAGGAVVLDVATGVYWSVKFPLNAVPFHLPLYFPEREIGGIVAGYARR